MKFGNTFSRTRTLASTAAGVAMMVALSSAATAQDVEEDEVVATGIRQSIKQSIAVKRESTSIVEAISAEDIGKLPDVSIAESLARLPGLAAQRVRGRAQVISVRGLAGDFTTALLNGREQVTAGDNRGVEFDQFPSELLGSAVVYKTPDATLLGAGLAGTVDLKTIRPLEYGRRAINVNARYEINDQGALNAGSEDTGYRLTGTYIDSNEAGTVGWMLGVATQSSPTQGERWEAWGYPTTGPNNAAIIGGAKPYVESRELERDAVVGTLEFAPNDKLSITADAFYSKFKDGGILRGIELPLQWSGAQLQPGYTEQNGIVSQGVFNGVQGVVRNDARSRDANILSLGLNVGYEFNDKWSADFDISSSVLDRDDRDLETYSGTGRGSGNGAFDNLGFALNGDGGFVFNSSLDYSDPSLFLLTDPQGWGQAGFIKEPKTKDELQAIRATVKRNMSDRIFDSVELGVNLTTRDKSKRSEEAFLDLAGGVDTLPIPANALLGTTSLDFLGIAGMVSYDPNALLASGTYSVRPNTNADVITKAWDVEEDVLTLFTKLNIDSEISGLPVKGNAGVQIVSTEQSSTGAVVGGGGLSVTTDGAEYTDVLPSLNLSVELKEDLYFRVGAARTLARARMEQMKASQGVGLNSQICGLQNGVPFFNQALYSLENQQTCISGGGGNPQLRPYKSNSFDVSLEKYFADQSGYFSIAGFRKELDDFIFDGVTQTSAQDQVVFDFSPIATDVFGSAFVAANPLVSQGLLTKPVNSEGGFLQGIELATNIPGDSLSPMLEGFGVQASYSYTDSEVVRPGDSDPTEIPGLSESVANLTAYYENNGFQIRLSNRYRSDFLGEVVGFGANTEKRIIKESNVLDGQIGYEFQEGPAEGLSILLQAYNLGDEDYTTYIDDSKTLVKDFQSYGRSYLVGVGYKF